MQRLVFNKRRQKGYIGRFSSARWQIEANFFQFFAQLPAAVFALRSAQNAAKKRGIETLGRREAPLHLANGHLVLGRRREQREPAGHRAKGVRRGSVGERQHVVGGVAVARVMVMMMVVVVARQVVR